jgi:ankyrin repeat protein
MWSPLHDAADMGERDRIRVLLEGKADVNAVNTNNATPLHRAALRGNVTCVRLLLEGKADVNAVNTNNATPLHCALFGCFECVSLLLEGKADVNATNERGEIMLFDLLLARRVVYEPPPYLLRAMLRMKTTLILEHDIDLSLKDKYGTTIVEAIKRPVQQFTSKEQEAQLRQLMQEH